MLKKLKFDNVFEMKYENCFQTTIEFNFIIIRSANFFAKSIKEMFTFLNSFKKKFKNETFNITTSISFKQEINLFKDVMIYDNK